MDAEERLQRLEQELAANRAANAEINNALQAIMTKLSSEPTYRDMEFLDPEDDPMPRVRVPNPPHPILSTAS